MILKIRFSSLSTFFHNWWRHSWTAYHRCHTIVIISAACIWTSMVSSRHHHNQHHHINRVYRNNETNTQTHRNSLTYMYTLPLEKKN